MKEILLFLFIIWLLYPSPTKTVFNETEYNIYEIFFSNNMVNTNNIEDYLDGIRLLTIYPYINPIYKDKMPSLKSYSFQDEVNISKFINYYVEELEKAGYKNEAIKYKTSGINIVKIKVYAKEETLIQNNFTYKLIAT